jgi:hypothetical protein
MLYHVSTSARLLLHPPTRRSGNVVSTSAPSASGCAPRRRKSIVAWTRRRPRRRAERRRNENGTRVMLFGSWDALYRQCLHGQFFRISKGDLSVSLFSVALSPRLLQVLSFDSLCQFNRFLLISLAPSIPCIFTTHTHSPHAPIIHPLCIFFLCLPPPVGASSKMPSANANAAAPRPRRRRGAASVLTRWASVSVNSIITTNVGIVQPKQEHKFWIRVTAMHFYVLFFSKTNCRKVKQCCSTTSLSIFFLPHLHPHLCVTAPIHPQKPKPRQRDWPPRQHAASTNWVPLSDESQSQHTQKLNISFSTITNNCKAA